MLYSPSFAPVKTTARLFHYWPCELLHAFTLELAARGICVHEAMMLGDADYARQKMSQAIALRDPAVDQLVLNMLDYFEPPHQAG
jgi:hypothetical protein